MPPAGLTFYSNAPSTWGRRIVMGTVFEPLIRYLPPEPGQVAGSYASALARSWRVMPSQTEIRIELQTGVKFHDGQTMSSVGWKVYEQV